MSHEISSPDAPIQGSSERGEPARADAGMEWVLPSPGLAAMTRRYIDGEISLSQLLSFGR